MMTKSDLVSSSECSKMWSGLEKVPNALIVLHCTEISCLFVWGWRGPREGCKHALTEQQFHGLADGLSVVLPWIIWRGGDTHTQTHTQVPYGHRKQHEQTRCGACSFFFLLCFQLHWYTTVSFLFDFVFIFKSLIFFNEKHFGIKVYYYLSLEFSLFCAVYFPAICSLTISDANVQLGLAQIHHGGDTGRQGTGWQGCTVCVCVRVYVFVALALTDRSHVARPEEAACCRLPVDNAAWWRGSAAAPP